MNTVFPSLCTGHFAAGSHLIHSLVLRLEGDLFLNIPDVAMYAYLFSVVSQYRTL